MAPSSINVAEVAFHLATVAVLLYPRVDPNDRSFIGGDFSHKFRQAVVALAAVQALRCLLLSDLRFEDVQMQASLDRHGQIAIVFYSVVVAFEGCAQSVLFLLMPYFLLCQLRDRINVRPGRDLMPWLSASLLLELVGAAGRSFVSPRFWAVKRLGDALSVFPVVRTVKLHNNIIHGQSRIVVQTLLAIEFCALSVTLLSALSYGTATTRPASKTGNGLASAGEPDDGMEVLLSGFRIAGFFVPSFRLFFHGFVLNMLDETMHRVPYYSTSDARTAGEEAANETNSPDDPAPASLEVSLVRSALYSA